MINCCTKATTRCVCIYYMTINYKQYINIASPDTSQKKNENRCCVVDVQKNVKKPGDNE